MPEAEWGTKRICPTTGQRFYDLNKDPIVSPYTGEVVSVDSNKGRTMVADAQDAQTKKMEEAEAEAENVVLEDDVEVDLGDDVLEDDDDETVSLDEITDVAAEDDDS
ncbi:MAG: TIGR02300 family protein [Planktomarina sp.]|nr:TIGR02300 family protein [Planktomarina sp.]MDT2033998.1 TIGR02300 family protein [Planktomarina sp.]MDT2039714.1 TIGR02300 family protein [Planktomarina sp.]MDT2050022.1 TIGR02300 family protein [Planktomarina sp.]|tara:strand:- start:286 stop:606 length:321 start_codon:yes stop_codon:yes gene_type:complete